MGIKSRFGEPVQFYSISGGENCNGIGDCLEILGNSHVLHSGDDAYPECVSNRCTGIAVKSLSKTAQVDDASEDTEDAAEINATKSKDPELVKRWRKCNKDADCYGPRHPKAICFKGWCIEDTYPGGN